MSDTDHIGNPAEPVSRPRSVTPRHPLLTGPTMTPSDIRDALNKCTDTLYMLSDLFGDTDMEHSTALDSAAARRGMFWQLQGAASTLEAIEELLGIEAEQARAEREARREAEREAAREVEDRIAADPALTEKAVMLGKVFAELFRQTFQDEPAKETA